MKKIYVTPELDLSDIECDSVMGNFFSDPYAEKVPDDPTDVEEIPLDPTEEELDEDNVIVNSKGGGFFTWW